MQFVEGRRPEIWGTIRIAPLQRLPCEQSGRRRRRRRSRLHGSHYPPPLTRVRTRMKHVQALTRGCEVQSRRSSALKARGISATRPRWVEERRRPVIPRPPVLPGVRTALIAARRRAFPNTSLSRVGRDPTESESGSAPHDAQFAAPAPIVRARSRNRGRRPAHCRDNSPWHAHCSSSVSQSRLKRSK
jgi:hypothetical protein